MSHSERDGNAARQPNSFPVMRNCAPVLKRFTAWQITPYTASGCLALDCLALDCLAALTSCDDNEPGWKT